jgi:hypothetical protein
MEQQSFPEDKTKEYLAAAHRVQGLMRTIGNTEKTKVKVGQRGKGSFFNWQDGAISIDPRDFDRGEEKWLGIGAHEAMHVRISRGDAVPEDVWKKQGLNYLFQTVEDARVYQATANIYPGAGVWMQEAYKSIEENDRLNLEYLQQQVGGELGYIPLTTRFCVEVQKRRVLGKIDENLPPRVAAAIEKTSPFIDQILQDLPQKDAKEEEIRKSTQNASQVLIEHVWPEFEELMKRDEENENLRQYMMHLLTKEELEVQEIIELLELDENEEKELGVILQTLQEHIQIQRQRDEEKKFNLIDFDGISGEIRKKLLESREKLLNKQQQDKQKQQAKDTLDKIEDEAVEAMRPQLMDPEEFETHEEQQKRIVIGRKKRNELPEEEREIQRQPSYIRHDDEKLTYEQGYDEVAPDINDLHERLAQIIKPTKYPQWKRGFPTGGRVDLKRAMQFEADRNQYNKLMERKSVPQLRDARFSTLFDCSFSMTGENILQAFKMGIVTGNVYEEFLDDFEFLMFNTFPDEDDYDHKELLESYILKRFGEPFQQTQKKRLERLFEVSCGDRSESTDLAPAVSWASERLDENAGRDNYLLVVTDGEPSPGTEYDVKRVIKAINKKHNQTIIGIGIGDGTQAVKKYFPIYVQVPNVKLFIPAIGDLLADITDNPDKYRQLL